MLRDEKTQLKIREAFRDLEQVAQGQVPSRGLTPTLALAILGLHHQVARIRQDQEYILQGVRSVLKALADDHREVHDFLTNSPGARPRYENE